MLLTRHRFRPFIYIGIINDPDRREKKHEQNKEFGHVHIIGDKTTREVTEKWEEEHIIEYMKNYNNKTPHFNKNEECK